jgi:hypothetical protein
MHMSRRRSTTFLWIEALICFGPLAFVVLLGTLIFPFWIMTLAAAITGAGPWVDGAGRTMWDFVRSMSFVTAGIIGLIGLVRVLLVLSRNEHPPRRSKATVVMVLVGLLALVSFHLYRGHVGRNPMSFLVYFLLPGIGSAHLLYLTRALWLPSQNAAG